MAADGMTNKQDLIEFESLVVPHLDEAYRLARWLMPSASEAEDVVQDAMLRAFTYFGTFRGTNAKPWILKIVRNTYGTARAAGCEGYATARYRRRRPVVLSHDC